MRVRTRFAPSPTGHLHIGSARTALFNYLFAKKHQGDFLLRIEDTDQARSTKEAVKTILDSMKWLQLQPDEEIIYQSQRKKRHIEIAEQLIAAGKAYYCYEPQANINLLREQARAAKKHFIFHSKWREAAPGEFPEGVKPVIRLKAPRTGTTIINDLLQGEISVNNDHLDDMILVRNDGTPTYMLAVVVDDHDMEITHIIRGDDHLANAHRQKLIYEALAWSVPAMVHIPLIYGMDGTKLSKRHGAVGADKYQAMGYLPEALNNYLLRLGWSHGDEEIISREQAIKWFDIDGLGKSPARIDFAKMRNINAKYLREYDAEKLAAMIIDHYKNDIPEKYQQNLLKTIDLMKPRAETLNDLYEMAKIFIMPAQQLNITEPALEIIAACSQNLRQKIIEQITAIELFSKENIQIELKKLAEQAGLKLGELMKYVRAFITGQINSPSVFEIMEIIGQEESLLRLKK